ncbi:MAG TPA: hypothetical protein VFE96_06530 [Candidatus Bathyarchaeia archaeon]|nr:hypothetical protein [Candidatus Bathyarchaeia archaeon]
MARRTPHKVATKNRTKTSRHGKGNQELSASRESIKAAEDLALAAFASGLKLAAAFGTVAAKTTSLALASIATGADKFSELVKQESLRRQNSKWANAQGASLARNRRKRIRRVRARQILA